MSDKFLDISVTLNDDLPTWPDAKSSSLEFIKQISDTFPANVSQLSLNNHTGTHLDAPLHFVPDGGTVSQIPLDKLMGPCIVVDTGEEVVINSEWLQERFKDDEVHKKILFKTKNSADRLMHQSSFEKDFVALSSDGAAFLADNKVELVGIDYLSIQKFMDGPKTHQVLLGNQIVILEGIDLNDVNPGIYELYCLPIKLGGAEGAPCRAVLQNINRL